MRPSFFVSLLVSSLCAVGCGSPPPPKEPTNGATGPGGTEDAISAANTGGDAPQPKTTEPPPIPKSNKPVEVNTKETPVLRCGAKDSYVYVASEFKCPDGGNPLGGDVMAGAKSRVGNVGANSTGHIIDLYEVPCASGPHRVYVDMYGCPGKGGGGF